MQKLQSRSFTGTSSHATVRSSNHADLLWKICVYTLVCPYLLPVFCPTVVMTADKVLKVCVLILMYRKVNSSTGGIDLWFHCWDFRFVTLVRPSSSLTPLTWRWWERFPGWPPKSSRACPSQRPATPTPMAWWALKPYHNTTVVDWS